MNKINIFILAAGLGERLRPITDHIPKPLLPILGKPALQHVLDSVQKLPFNKIGINVHYKKEMISEWVGRCSLKDQVIIFPEDKVLGTGGALKNAGSFLKERTFLVHNSDILSDIDLEKLLEYHSSSNNMATLAVHNYPKFNNLVVDENDILLGLAGEHPYDAVQKRAYTGIAVYEPGFLNLLPEGGSSVVDVWLDALSSGHRIGTYDVTGCCWNDIGTPSAYASVVFNTLRKEGEIVYVHPATGNCINVDMHGHVVIEEDCIFDRSISLKNCILLPGSNAGSIHEPAGQGCTVENCIIGPGIKIDLNEADVLDSSEEGRQLIGTGGSDRRYYRVRSNDKSVVLMHCKSDDPDFGRHMEYSDFLLNQSMPVPELLKKAPGSMQAFFEDAGDMSLYSYLRCPREKSDIESLYRKVIDILILLHTEVTDHVSECPLLQERVFDYELFRWETDYFVERFVVGVRSIKENAVSGLDSEFHDIALKADSYPKTIIHRDFQSQNIMIMKGMELRILDYQGARMGPPAYDLASFLWDPYYRLEDGVRERLLDYYINGMKDRTSGKFDGKLFRDSLVLCRIQRHMQALGAYGFLSSVKGKKYFLKYVPEGLRVLKEDISLARKDYPGLYKLVMVL